MLIGRFIRYHVDPLICVHCHIDPLNTMLTPDCCYRATPLLLNRQCMHECCVQSPMGSLAVAEYTFSERASARERVTLRVCVCVCVPLCGDWQCLSWYLQSLSLDRSLAAPPTATATRRRQQIYQLLGSPYMWLHCLHGWHSKLLYITIWVSYTKYIVGIWHCGIYLSYDRDMTNYLSYTCHIPVIYLSYDRYMTIYLSYTCHMTGIGQIKVCHTTM